MLTFPKTLVDGFRRTQNGKRYGQEFYDYAQLHKVQGSVDDRDFCQRLYQERNEQNARTMIASRTDPDQ